jgi:hypothetical protein
MVDYVNYNYNFRTLRLLKHEVSKYFANMT